MMCGDDSSGIILDGLGIYRYSLWRVWDIEKPTLCWILLNPSTADENKLDPTLKRCKVYSETWGYGGFTVVNIFGLRATDPRKLFQSKDPVGSSNNYHILKECLKNSKIIGGWGNRILKFKARLKEIDKILSTEEIYSLKLTNLSQPAHPLYLRGDLRPVLYKKVGESLLEVCNYHG